jgi:putative DNA primase/helicase
MSILKTLIESGLSVIPVGSDKQPKLSWKPYTKAAMTVQQAAEHFAQGDGVAVICGSVSGGLECIDVDTKYDLDGTLWEQLSHAIQEYDPELWAQLVIQRSKSGGYHLFYRVVGWDARNAKLAMRPATQAELDTYNATAQRQITEPDRLPKVLVETRANDGYVLVEPSTGYKVEQGSFTNIPTIDAEQRAALMYLCGMFNQIVAKPTIQQQKKEVPSSDYQGDEKTPWADFNEQHTALEIVKGYGWEQGKQITSDVLAIIRPGAQGRERSGVYLSRSNTVHIFTTSSPLPNDQTFNPFAVYAYYEHAGDFKAAARELRSKGYGTPPKRQNHSSADTKPNTTPPPVETTPNPATDAHPTNNEPFSLLGYRKADGTQYFAFFVRSSKIVVELTAPQMSTSNLMTLAPLQYWEMNYPKPKGGMDVLMAQNALIQQSNALGFFDAARVRGRGAWRDGKDTIIHVGNELIKNGKPYRLGEIKTTHIYEAAASLGLRTGNPLGTKAANRLMEILNLLSWERDVNSLLLAGWCVVAPVCGVLEWRPHLWLTGGKGTGKSWIFLKIIRRLLGEASLAVQGKSSEAGIRQMLKYDAVPVVFDELEATDQDTNSRIQNVLGLMRAASADDGGIHALGTSGGTAQTYRIRSCFAFASISVALDKQSDRSRVTVLGLTKKGTQAERKTNFDNIQRLYAEIVTDDFVHRLQARTISLIPTIIANARTFSAAAAVVIGEQRLGDQVGALLAGAYTLFSDKVISYDDALAWVQQRDWSEEKGMGGTEDETALLSFLVEHITEVDAERKVVKRNVGELIQILRGGVADDVREEEARQRLYRMGFKVDLETGSLFVSDSATYIKSLLAKTAWANNHNKILIRLEGAAAVKVTRFGSTMSTRAVKIPLSLIDKE